MSQISFQTSRLLLRQFKESDYPYFVDYFSNEATARFVGGIKSKEEAWRLLATYVGHWQLKGFGYMAIEESKSGKFVGCVGLWKSEPWPELELGYWLLPEIQGKGYATEAASALKEFAFQKLKVDTLVSYIDPENLASRKLAERIGGELEEVIELLQFGPHCVYRYEM